MALLDSLTWHVMDATADDWESLEQILPHLRRFHGVVDPSEAAEVIVRLVRDGLMEEMRHGSVDAQAVVKEPIEYWFRMTPLGRSLWDSEGAKYRDE
ncbi:MAG TPA: hypothetical protein VJX92_18490 [Methylomirabilota bacterium]|nr:hypothetical protein [Methylomirabilota bacterium]